MSDTSKREMIEEAAKAIGEVTYTTSNDQVRAARAALAVFEQAHTPPAHRRSGCGCATRQIRYVDGEWSRELELVPCDEHRRTEQAYTPTDDEREARQAAEERYPTTRPHDHEPTYPRSALRHYMQGAFISGWNASRAARRTAVQEPSECLDCGRTDGGCDRVVEPQGEPTDAHVRAVWDALGPAITVAFEYDELRAALRAAYETRGEGR